MNKYKDKRILVTGATGLIGTHLVWKLLEAGAYVVVMGRNEEKIKQVFQTELKNGRFSYVIGNIANGIDGKVGVLDYIFHAASPISGAEIRENPVDTISANLDGARSCLEYLKNQKEKAAGRMVVFSSATVYGNHHIQNAAYKEEQTDYADALHTGNTPYSESKRMTEVLARAYYIQYHIDIVIARIGYVYGYAKRKPDTAFYEFIGKAVRGEDIILNGSGMAPRDNIHVNDVVSGLLVIAEKGASGEAYNLSSNGDKDNFRAIDEIAAVIADCVNSRKRNSKIKAVAKPMEGERKPGIKMDNEKIKGLGWNIKVNLKDGIKDTMEKYMK